MPAQKLILGLVLIACLFGASSQAQEREEECPYPKGRQIENLTAVLENHDEWIRLGGWKDPAIPGRANLCNADLRGQNLQLPYLGIAYLRWANLQGADLRQTNLELSSLAVANLRGARLDEANLQKVDLTEADLRGAVLRKAKLQGAKLINADLRNAWLDDANLEQADVRDADLQGARLSRADMQDTFLFGANLQGASLRLAHLHSASLTYANLRGADLHRANLERADLAGAKLQEANLSEANLQQADLHQSVLSGAVLYKADLSGAIYEPSTAPASGRLAGLVGLDSVWHCPNEESGLVLLREALRSIGLRELEREATRSLESVQTSYLLARWPGQDFRRHRCGKLEGEPLAAIEGVFRLVFFEWTTDYGLAYGRPLLILLALIGVFTLLYLPALRRKPGLRDRNGIFRVWPSARIEPGRARFEMANEAVIEPLGGGIVSGFWYAFHFSVLSAFQIGWRDLNVGSWLSRLQLSEYTLRAKGWPRVISGLQSLISVYLLAMWALTYFGRPFQ